MANGPIDTPAGDLIMGNTDPNQKGPGEYNGCTDWPGADKRTSGGTQVPEKTLDKIQGE